MYLIAEIVMFYMSIRSLNFALFIIAVSLKQTFLIAAILSILAIGMALLLKDPSKSSALEPAFDNQ